MNHIMTMSGKAVMALLGSLMLTMTASQSFAATSGDTTIHNRVTVTYGSGNSGAIYSATSSVNVSVLTLASAPIVTSPAPESYTTGDTVSLAYSVLSTANGYDIYTTGGDFASRVLGNVNDSSSNNIPADIALWGGIVVRAGDGVIRLPGGTVGNLNSGDTVALQVGSGGSGTLQRYSVTVNSQGAPASTDNATGTVTPEVYAELGLSPIGGAPAISSTNVSIGTQVGQYAEFVVTYVAGAPTTAGVVGTYTETLAFTSTATDGSNATVTTISDELITSVNSPQLAITKTASTDQAKPGENVTYTIEVANGAGFPEANNVSITDVLSDYVELVDFDNNGALSIRVLDAGGTGSDPSLEAADSVASYDDISRELVVNLGVGATASDGGTIAPGTTWTVLLTVQVQ